MTEPPMLVRHVLDPDGRTFSAAEVVDDALSVVWTERWQAYGEVQARLPPGRGFALGDVVTMPGRDMAAEVVAMTETESALEIRCRDALSVLDRRIVYPTVANNGLVSTFVRRMLVANGVQDDVAGTGARVLRPVRVGDLSAIAGSASIQRSYGQMGETLLELGRAYGFDPVCTLEGAGWRTGSMLVIGARTPSAERVWGVGRNLAGYIVDSDMSQARNVAYVGAQTSVGGSRIVRATGETSAESLDRREMFVDRRDLPMDGMDLQTATAQHGEVSAHFGGSFETVTRGDASPYEVVDMWMSANVVVGAVPMNARMRMAEALGNTDLVGGMVAAASTTSAKKSYRGAASDAEGGWAVTIEGTRFLVPYSVLSEATLAVSPQVYAMILSPIGEAALAELQPQSAFEAETEGLEPYRDYSLGDKVRMFLADGSSRSMRVVEIVESWDSQGYRATPGLASL